MPTDKHLTDKQQCAVMVLAPLLVVLTGAALALFGWTMDAAQAITITTPATPLFWPGRLLIEVDVLRVLDVLRAIP